MPDIQPTEENILLIQKSIRHWEELWEGIGMPGSKSCALCNKYWSRDEDVSCKGCPVSEKSGSIYCESTPYYEASELWDEWEVDEENEARKITPEFQKAADAEIDFLVSLLPDKMQLTYKKTGMFE